MRRDPLISATSYLTNRSPNNCRTTELLQLEFNSLKYPAHGAVPEFGGVAVAIDTKRDLRTKGDTMKKTLLIFAMLLSSFAFVPSTQAAEVKSGAVLNAPQLRIQIGRRHRRNWERRRDWAYGDRVGYGRTFTRDVRYGFRTYRETYQVVNGRTMLISRVRLY